MLKKMLIISLIFLISCTNTVTSNVVKEYGPEPEVYFCPRDNCEARLVDLINNAENFIHCAFYDLDLNSVIEVINKTKIDTKLVMDNENFINFSFAKKDPRYGLMHNKFCIIDDTVWTGSFNPTERGNNVNNNNVVIFHSKNIAAAFEEEFQELWDGEFRKGLKNSKQFFINNKEVEVYFCPEDWCANKVIYALDKANSSIYFMTFSFTHDKIADVLINKKDIEIKGVIEKFQNNKYSKYDKLKDNSINVIFDSNNANMHHKVFIIDKEIVITGSFNPTMGGDTRNDENLVIIHDKKLAEMYLEEFKYIWELP